MTKNNRLTSDLTIEQLLAALDKDVPIDLVEQPTILPQLTKADDEYNEYYQTASFLAAFKITEGKHFIKGSVLYELFKLWNKGTKLSSKSFHLQLAKIMKNLNPSGGASYRVNERALRLVNYIAQYKKKHKQKPLYNKDYRKHFEKFFNELNIRPGNLYVEADILYHVYDTHQYNNRRKTYNFRIFENICKLFFEDKYPDKTVLPFFGVNEDIKQHISESAVRNWRQGRKQFNDNKIRKKLTKEDKKDLIYPEEE